MDNARFNGSVGSATDMQQISSKLSLMHSATAAMKGGVGGGRCVCGSSRGGRCPPCPPRRGASPPGPPSLPLVCKGQAPTKSETHCKARFKQSLRKSQNAKGTNMYQYKKSSLAIFSIFCQQIRQLVDSKRHQNAHYR